MVNKYDVNHTYREDGMIASELGNQPIVIYGCGGEAEKLYKKLQEKQNKVIAFVDSNRKLWGKRLHKVYIFSPSELSNFSNIDLVLAFHQWNEIINSLCNHHFVIYADYPFIYYTQKQCIICKSMRVVGQRAHFAPFLVERMNIYKNTEICHCLSCNFYYSGYRPTENEMEMLYNDYRGDEYYEMRKKYEPQYSRDIWYEESRIEHQKKGVYSFIKDTIKLDKVSNLLDWGGDRGQFIPDEFIKVNKYVYDISGVSTVNDVKSIEKNDLTTIHWDLITASNLFEHVSDPRMILSEMIHIAPVGCYIYIDVPYQDYFDRYSDAEIHEHINFFRLETFKKIGQLFDLKIIKLNCRGVIRVLFQKQ